MGRKKGKRQLDPSRDEAESTDSEKGEGDEVNHTACPHVGKAVQLSSIKKTLKIAWVRVGQCTTCLKESKTTTTPVKRVRNEVLRKELGGKLTLQEIKKEQLERAKAEQRAAAEKLKKEREAKAEESSSKTDENVKPEESSSKTEENVVKPIVVKDGESADKPVQIKAEESKEVEKPSNWLCMRCGFQGCGNNAKKHSYSHYKQPRSDLHCLVVNTDTWTIWCYECQTEIYVDSHKKLYEAVEFVKKVKGQSKVPIQPKNNTLPFGGVIKTAPKDVPASNLHAGVGSSGTNSLPLPRVKGLNNLGNTCFFNSVMQCLSQTHILTQFIDLQVTQGVNFIVPGSSANIQEESDSDSSHTNIFSDLSLRLAEGGPMITSLAAFLKDMHSGGKSLVISPGHLFGQVVKQSPKFRGMQQQDSHELLRYLMDGLRSEESKRQKSAILKNFDLTEKTDPKNVPAHLRRKLQAYGRQGNHTLLDKIFSGQMVSTIVCEECHHSSQMYEQFLDLSLPVVEDKPTKPHKSPKKQSETVLPDDEGQVSCCGAQEDKKRSKGQIKKEKERKRKENRSKKFSRQVSKAESIEEKEEGEKKIREELQGTDKFEKVELKIEDVPKIVDGSKPERQNSVTWKDGNIDEEEGYEEGEEEGVAEDEGDWEWDYGGPLEDKQQLVFKPKSKETTETNDDTSDYLDTSVVEDPSRLVTLNPLPEINNEFDHERSSERTGNNSEEETNETNETGASSNGDVEDNDCEDDKGKWVLSKNLLNNLQKLDNLMMNNDNLDPHMQELCKGISQLRMEKSEVVDKAKQQKQRVKAEWTARTLTSLAPRYLSSPGECSIYSCLNSFTQSELLTGPNKWACDSCTENKKLNSADNSDCSSSSKKSSTVYSSASKQLLLFSPPAVLTLHLKRFQQTLSGCKKVNKHVAFPLELDLAAFCSSTSIAMPNVSLGQRRVLYSLYGVVEHSGRLQGGHYTAFVKVRAANSSLKDPTIFFSPAVSKASDVPQFLEEIEGKFKNNEIIVGKEDVEETNNNLTLSQPRRWYHVSDSSVSEVSEEKVLKAQAYLLFYERIL